MPFRLIRQPEIAYITEAGKAYGEDAAPRMAWAAPPGHLFQSGWEVINMGLGNAVIAAKIKTYLIRVR